MSGADRIYRANDREVASKVIDGEAVLINLTNGKYYSLTGAGGFVWQRLLEGGASADIAADVVVRFDVNAVQARRDIDGLVKILQDEGLITESAAAGAPRIPDPGTGGTRATYDPPHLHVYTDMGDLLALDPPMPGLDDIPWKPEDETLQRDRNK